MESKKLLQVARGGVATWVLLLLGFSAVVHMAEGQGQAGNSEDGKEPVDACQVAGAAIKKNGGLAPYEVAMACQSSFPFNATVALATIDTLKKMLPFYAFESIARDSPSPFLPSRVLLHEELERIETAASQGWFWNEFEFDARLSKLFRSLNDAHTEYRPTCSIGSWYYTHGVSLVGVVENQELKIRTAPPNLQALGWLSTISAAANTDLLAFADAEVVTIDGTPAADYIIDFADAEVGQVKDLNARVNKALLTVSIGQDGQQAVSFGTFFLRRTPPSAPTLTFTFKKADDENLHHVTVPYFAYYTGQSFSSASEYWDLNCESSPVSGGGGSSPRAMNVEDVLSGSTTESARGGKSGDEAVVSLSPGLISAFSIPASNVGVITIPTVSQGTAVDRNKWRISYGRSFVAAVKAVKDAGSQKLILDLTQNGGGDVMIGYWVVSVLFPGAVPNLPTVARAGPLPDLMAATALKTNTRRSLYHWSNWADASSDAPFDSAKGWYFPPVERTFGGEKGYYSRRFQDLPPSMLTADLTAPFGTDKPVFAARDILILTNGFCGSTCSLITSCLSQRFRVRTVTVGGVPGEPQQVSNFPGGQVMTLAGLRAELELLRLGGHKLAPKPLMRKGRVSFTWRMVFGVQSSEVPLEFLFTPSTFNLDYTSRNAYSPFALWQEVAKLFKRRTMSASTR